MNYAVRTFALCFGTTIIATLSVPSQAENVQSIKVTPQAKVEYAEITTTLIAPKKLKGLTAVGIRPAGQQYQLMGQLVPRSDVTELRFILEKGAAGEAQIFDVF